MATISRDLGAAVRRATGWLRQAEGWQVALLVLALFFLLPLMPLMVVLAILAAVVMFARAWLREFTHLMRLGDDAFPGHNDKLIWAILLIVLPPVGAWLFQTYREVHWPEAKPTKGGAEAFDY